MKIIAQLMDVEALWVRETTIDPGIRVTSF